MFRRIVITGLAALIVAAPLAPAASAQRGRDRDDQREEHRQNAFQGSTWRDGGRDEQRGGRSDEEREVPLGQIIRELRSRYGGQHLDAQKMGGRYVISWLAQDGRRLVIEVDAASGRTISVR